MAEIYHQLSPTDKIMVWSLLYLHILLGFFALAMLIGREAAIIGDAFSATLLAILGNLGALSGNVFLQKFGNRFVNRTQQTTVSTTETTSATPAASTSTAG